MSGKNGSFLNTGDFVRVNKMRETGVGRSMAMYPVTATLHVPSPEVRVKGLYFNIRVNDDMMTQLDWQPRMLVDVYEGTGSSAGKVVLAPSTETKQTTGYTLSLASQAVSKWEKAGGGPTACAVKVAVSSLEQHMAQSDETIRAKSCEYEVMGSELRVTMPGWFRVKDTRDDEYQPVARQRRGRPPTRAQATRADSKGKRA